MKTILLTKGKKTLVDDEDFEWLNQWKWHCSNTGYAIRTVNVGYDKGKRISKKVRMHRFILNPPDNMQTDHINQNKLDNRRSNLRVCTHQENNFNHHKSRSNTSGQKGVHWYKAYSKWQVYISINGKRKNLGYYLSKKEATKTYNNAVLEYHGKFASLN